jgi:hypothetical protein
MEVMRNWLTIAEPGEPEQLLDETNPALRPKVALLMRDLLSRYPATIVGIPMLLQAAPDFEDPTTTWATGLALPTPESGDNRPCEELEFLGWIPAESQLPLALPFDAEQYPREVPWMKPKGLVVLFRSKPDLFDLDSIELPNQWWGKLFRNVSANVHLTARMVLPYPDAIEAARLLQALSRGEPAPDKGHFLSDSAWSYASDEAAMFQESCRHVFPNVSS